MISNRRRRPRAVRLIVSVMAVAITASIALQALASPSATEPTDEFASRTFRTEDGLPIGIVYALAQDSDGYLWIGGSGGLVRFDGIQFVPWGAHGEPPLPYGEVRSLLADRDGGLWIGFNEEGVLSRLEGGRLRTYTTQDGLPGGVVDPSEQDHSGTIWATGPGGITAFRGDTWQQLQEPRGLPRVTVSDLHEDRSGNLWVSTADGLFRRGRGHDRFELVDRTSSAVTEDAHGGLWVIDSRDGIRRLVTESSDESEHVSIAVTGGILLSDRHGHFWVGSAYRAGLLHVSLDPNTSQPMVTALADERGILDRLVLALLEDREGNVWAGTTGGLVRFYEPKIQMYSRADGLPDDNVRAIEATPNGELWLGTASGLARVTTQGIAEPTRIPGVRGRGVTSLHADHLGRLSIGFADSGVGILADGRFSAIDTPWPAASDNIITARPDNQDNVWVCNFQDGGVYHRRKQSPFTRIEGTSEPDRQGCSATLLDRSGRVWIGFGDGSLMVGEADGRHRFIRGEGAPRGRVCALHEDDERSIWVATTEGLSRYRDGTFATIDAQNGLPSDYLTAVIEDRNGHLWVSANSGIFRMTKEEFSRAASDPAYRVRYRLYDSSDGTSDTPVCYGEPHASRDRDGKLWFTSLSGAVVIDPARLPTESVTLSPRIERVVVDDVAIPPGSSSLPAGTARVELHYTAVSLSAGSKVRFQYRLDGFDTAWVDAGGRRQAFYTNLAPGRYEFQVRASVNEAAGPATMYGFDVQPTFYQTRPFYVASVAAAALLLWAVWQLRVRALHERYALIMNERTRIGREIHDTVLQSMAGVALEIEGIARQAQAPGPSLRDALANISNDIKEHIAEVRHTIWELRTPEEGTASLEMALREAAERILDGADVHFELSVLGTPHTGGREVERELIRIAREALRNAIQHANSTVIRLKIRYTADALRLIVTDDGRGFDTEEHFTSEDNHWGVLGMRERASRIGAQFTIDSQPGAGTAVEVIVPYTHAA